MFGYGGTPRVWRRQQRGCEQTGIGGTGLPDGESRDRNAGRHLRDRQQGIHAIECFAHHRNAEYRQSRFGGEHAGKVCGAAGAGDYGSQPTRFGIFGITEQQVGRAVGGDHPHFVRNAEGFQMLDGVLHGIPVTSGAHHHANQYRV